MANIKKFNEYTNPLNSTISIKDKKRDKNLADDLTSIQDELNKVEKAKNSDEFEIVSILDISKEEPKDLKEAVVINAELGNKEVKRGDIMYITAMLKKKKGTWAGPNVMGIVKVRVVDIFNSLSLLNTLK